MRHGRVLGVMDNHAVRIVGIYTLHLVIESTRDTLLCSMAPNGDEGNRCLLDEQTIHSSSRAP